MGSANGSPGIVHRPTKLSNGWLASANVLDPFRFRPSIPTLQYSHGATGVPTAIRTNHPAVAVARSNTRKTSVRFNARVGTGTEDACLWINGDGRVRTQ